MLHLPNGCRSSEPTVFPSNWRTSAASCDVKWKVWYRFYDPQIPPYKKLVVIKEGINEFNSVADRRAVCETIIKELKRMLQVEGYNPIRKTSISFDLSSAVHPLTSFGKAMDYAFEKTIMAHETRLDVRSMLKYFTKASQQLGFIQIPVGEIRRRHFTLIMERVAETRKLSPQRYNKYLAYLSTLWTKLVHLDAVEMNFVKDMEKRRVLFKIRKTLTEEEFNQVDAHLKQNWYTFWRYMRIFFESGGRIVELLRVKVRDVNLQDQTYRAIINKGQNSREVIRVITNDVLHIWKELLEGADPEHYVFSRGLVPGPSSIRREQITRRWEVHVKAPKEKGGLGIDVDFYPLKHLYLELVAKKYGIAYAQKMAGHTTPVITMRHYATGQAGRDRDELKGISVVF